MKSSTSAVYCSGSLGWTEQIKQTESQDDKNAVLVTRDDQILIA